MLSAVDKVSLNIRDQDAAKRFWVETMGFTLVQDSPMGDDPSSALDRGTASGWRRHGHPVQPQIRRQPARLPQQRAVHLRRHSTDLPRVDGARCGVPDPPGKQFWGWWATFKDNEGNLYGLGQRDAAVPHCRAIPVT